MKNTFTGWKLEHKNTYLWGYCLILHGCNWDKCVLKNQNWDSIILQHTCWIGQCSITFFQLWLWKGNNWWLQKDSMFVNAHSEILWLIMIRKLHFIACVGCSLLAQRYQVWVRKLRGWWFVTKCRGSGDAWDLRVPIPVLGSSLTLNVDMAGSLLYLSMVWNLDEWLSSWYSSECLLRVCITFWKGRKEGTAKMKSTETNPNKKGNGKKNGWGSDGS